MDILDRSPKANPYGFQVGHTTSSQAEEPVPSLTIFLIATLPPHNWLFSCAGTSIRCLLRELILFSYRASILGFAIKSFTDKKGFPITPYGRFILTWFLIFASTRVVSQQCCRSMAYSRLRVTFSVNHNYIRYNSPSLGHRKCIKAASGMASIPHLQAFSLRTQSNSSSISSIDTLRCSTQSSFCSLPSRLRLPLVGS